MSKIGWFENEAFWQDMQAKVYGPDQAASASTEAELAMRLVGHQPPARVLDLCCGNGRHAIALACAGYSVTGVDLSATYLSLALQDAISVGVDIEWMRGDIRNFVRPQVFDVAMILWNAFGYFESEAEHLATLTGVAQSLRPGGTLIIQTHGRESTSRKFTPKDWFEIGDTFVLDQRWIEGDWSRMHTRYVLLGPEGRREYKMSCQLWSPPELKRLLKSAGFGSISFSGALDGRPYNERAFELVIVAKR